MKCKEDNFHLGVKALIYNEKREILLLQKCFEKWDILGGRIQKDESLEDALKHEVFEETGLANVIPVNLLTMALSNIRISVQNGDVGLVLAVYECHVVDATSILLSDEHVLFEWVDQDQAFELLIDFPIELIGKR